MDVSTFHGDPDVIPCNKVLYSDDGALTDHPGYSKLGEF